MRFDENDCSLSEDERESFREAARPLMEWLELHGQPNFSVVVDSEHASLVETTWSLIGEAEENDDEGEEGDESVNWWN